MQPEIVLQVLPVSHASVPLREPHPVSPELGADLTRLELQQRIALDRKRQEELARLRAIQSFD